MEESSGPSTIIGTTGRTSGLTTSRTKNSTKMIHGSEDMVFWRPRDFTIPGNHSIYLPRKRERLSTILSALAPKDASTAATTSDEARAAMIRSVLTTWEFEKVSHRTCYWWYRIDEFNGTRFAGKFITVEQCAAAVRLFFTGSSHQCLGQYFYHSESAGECVCARDLLCENPDADEFGNGVVATMEFRYGRKLWPGQLYRFIDSGEDYVWTRSPGAGSEDESTSGHDVAPEERLKMSSNKRTEPQIPKSTYFGYEFLGRGTCMRMVDDFAEISSSSEAPLDADLPSLRLHLAKMVSDTRGWLNIFPESNALPLITEPFVFLLLANFCNAFPGCVAFSYGTDNIWEELGVIKLHFISRASAIWALTITNAKGLSWLRALFLKNVGSSSTSSESKLCKFNTASAAHNLLFRPQYDHEGDAEFLDQLVDHALSLFIFYAWELVTHYEPDYSASIGCNENCVPSGSFESVSAAGMHESRPNSRNFLAGKCFRKANVFSPASTVMSVSSASTDEARNKREEKLKSAHPFDVWIAQEFVDPECETPHAAEQQNSPEGFSNSGISSVLPMPQECVAMMLSGTSCDDFWFTQGSPTCSRDDLGLLTVHMNLAPLQNVCVSNPFHENRFIKWICTRGAGTSHIHSG